MSKIYLAEKSQLDAQNQILNEINTKIEPLQLSNVNVFVADFINDPLYIISGSLDTSNRRIFV